MLGIHFNILHLLLFIFGSFILSFFKTAFRYSLFVGYSKSDKLPIITMAKVTFLRAFTIFIPLYLILSVITNLVLVIIISIISLSLTIYLESKITNDPDIY